MVEDRERQKQARQQLQQKNRSLTDMVASAERRARNFDSSVVEDDGTRAVHEAALVTRDNSRRAYYREFRKVVEVADVIIEVLDARDPLGCRAKHIERYVMDSGTNKRIILLLNKIDLVPKDVAEQWLKYLRQEFPTVAFKASTQAQRTNLGHAHGASVNASSDAALSGTSQCVGADPLLQLLKNYSRNANLKTSLRVGVIGYPNVGKSSVINSLKRARVCQVGATPGVTKVIGEIVLDKNLRLLDCPGIVFSQLQDEREMMLRNCVKVELLEDPIAPVELIVERCGQENLMLQYTVPTFKTPREFLARLARVRGKLKKGGVPDLEAAARQVLNDWNMGKIPYYTLPPAQPLQNKETAQIVTTWAQEFQLGDVLDSEGLILDQAASKSNARAVVFTGKELMEEDVDFDSDEDESMMDENDDMDDDGEYEEDDVDAMSESDDDKAKVVVGKMSKKGKALEKKETLFTEAELALNPRLNQRKQQKARKNKAKTADEDYDFDEYFEQQLPQGDDEDL